MDARELVVDAALGLVDSIDLIGPNDVDGTAILYHHLLNCGLRLAATVGTDVWLSYSRGPLLSNPPGWARVYADLRGAPLSVGAFEDALRAGRTLATNGPWLDLQVDGRQPGDVIEAELGQTVSVSVRSEGLGVESLELIGPEGVVARSEATSFQPVSIDANVRVARSMWLCAVARGPQHPSVLGPHVFAHTSPVYIDVLGHALEGSGSARWLLDWLWRLEELIRTHGQFTNDTQRARSSPSLSALAATTWLGPRNNADTCILAYGGLAADSVTGLASRLSSHFCGPTWSARRAFHGAVGLLGWHR
jgi:hypothetical protein